VELALTGLNSLVQPDKRVNQKSVRETVLRTRTCSSYEPRDGEAEGAKMLRALEKATVYIASIQSCRQ
jgi:hypothetical protein